MTVLERYRKTSRRRDRRAARAHQRLDIQGLRMVAVLTVFANHLWGWPRGGFVGVDVFFVISGFLITGNLLRMAETTGRVSFRTFYWNRVRRIVPAATVVLIATYVAATLVFQPFRAQQVGVDAVFAFVFFANWHFAIEGTDYFAGGNAVSPLQHYWSLSIEEQFYFVWPALIFVISVVVIRKGWTHVHRMQLAGGVMGVVVAASLGWALWETVSAPTWAYFNTFARVWELGVGALLAIAAGTLRRIPAFLRPWLSWAGLALIAASLVLLADGATGFPAPWALLPVTGAALVIAAGVGAEPWRQEFLRNRASTYIGDISYSLYLVHWPVIVLLGALMERSPYYYVTALALAFALAVASYHGIENPLRRADRGTFQQFREAISNRGYSPKKASQRAGVGVIALLVVALICFMLRPDALKVATAPPDVIAATSTGPQPAMPPLQAALNAEIVEALKATEWPELNPTMDSVITGSQVPSNVGGCGRPEVPDEQACTWGTGDIQAVLVGDSVAMTYVAPLSTVALTPGSRLQIHAQAMFGCTFVDDVITSTDTALQDACPARKQHAIDVINTIKPAVVIITNSYTDKQVAATGKTMSPKDWQASMQRIVDKFRGSTTKVVFLAPPPSDVKISDCFGTRTNTPADCVSKVNDQWRSMAATEQALAKTLNGVWVDSRPWFCNGGRVCPSFVGTVPTKMDAVHMTPAYGQKIAPVIAETFTQAGIA